MHQRIGRVAQIPDAVSGYELDPKSGWFSVLIPQSITTLNTNPSFETNTTGYTAVNGSLTRVSSKQRRGVYSGQITPSTTALSGAYLTLATTTGSQYSCSLDLFDEAGRWFDLYFADSSGNRISRVASVRGANYWKRVFVNFAEYSGGTRRIYIARRAGGNTQPFYIDGVMVLPSEKRFAYFDGDSQGYLTGVNSYVWAGTPHASYSTMTFNNGSGGYEMNLLTLGLRIMAVVGLGLGQFANVSTPLSTGGELYQRSIMQARGFSLIGALMGNTLPELDRIHQGLIDAFKPNRVPDHQELTLLYHRTDPCTGEETETLRIPCIYESGLERTLDNYNQERVALAFKQHMPVFQTDGQQGVVLGYQTSIPNINNILYRDIDGTWKAMGTGLDGQAEAIVPAPDGSIYVGGYFTHAGGVVVNYVAKWNGSGWAAISGMNNYVEDLVLGPDGSLYAAGSFTTAGASPASRIAKWDGATWSALGSGMNGDVYTLTFGPDGTLYAGGNFTTAGGNPANYIAKWDGANWSALGSGLSAAPEDMVVGPDHALYVGGSFLNAGGIPVNYIAKWDGTAWSALGSGAENTVYSLTFSLDGSLIIGGRAGGGTGIVAKWNGSGWTTLGSATNYVQVVSTAPDGQIYIGGVFTKINGITFPDSAAILNNNTFIPLDVNVGAGVNPITAYAWDSLDRLYLGGNFSGVTALSANVTIPNVNADVAYPTFVFTGPGSLWQAKNYSTGKGIYFNTLTLLAGEVATLVTSPQGITFTSSFRGDLSSYLADSSQSLYLEKGTNNLSAYMTGTTAASSAVAYWTPTYYGLSGATH